MKLLACTDKGLTEFEYLNSDFVFKKVHFLGQPTAYLDTLNDQWRIAINHKHWGSKIHFSGDAGNSWTEIPAPKFPEDLQQENNSVTLKSIWNITAYDSHSFFIGAEPAAIFHTLNNGESYNFFNGVWNHPTRKHWVGGGKGSTSPFLHHIIIDPHDDSHLYAAISCAGVMESNDKGQSWAMINEGLKADFLSSPDAVAGHDPHCLKMSFQDPKIIWQQNHCGIFRTENGGKFWNDLTDNFPESGFGFCLAVDPKDDKRAWVIPCESDSRRIAPNNALTVYRSDDAGQSWQPLTNGLPQQGTFDIVLRHSLDINGSYLVFGTNNGNIYHSNDYGNNWRVVSHNLGPVRCTKLLD